MSVKYDKDLITVKLDGEIYRLKPATLTIDQESLKQELADQAKSYEEVARLYQRSKAARERFEMSQKKMSAQIGDKVRKSAKEKMSEDKVKEAIYLDPEYDKIIEEMDFLVRQEGDLQALTDAFSQRKETLLELARNRREELKNIGSPAI